MNTQSQGGAIELIVGPMFSGKSSELLRRVRRCAVAGKKAFVLSYKGDARYGQPAHVTTHDRASMKSKPVGCLQEADNEVWQYAVVAIDEGQFFPDLAKYAEKWANDGKLVLVAALDSTHQRQPFEPVQRVLPLCESVTKLRAVCKACLGEAAFTFRTSGETELEVLGGAEKYEARCRGCHRAGEATRSEFGSENSSAGKRRKSGGRPGSRRSSTEPFGDATNLRVQLHTVLNLR